MKFKMYFMPFLVAVLALLLYPSLVLAVGLGLITAAYLRFGGRPVPRATMKLLNGQIAYRMLSVKLLALNGTSDADTYHVHAMLTPDEPENAELRGLLRDAAATTGAGWKSFARTVRAVYGADPAQLLDRFEMLILQLRAQPEGVTAETQDRLIHLAKQWKIGPQKARSFLTDNNVTLSPAMLAWA